MKKILLSVCVLLAGIIMTNAQPVAIGLRAGVNFANEKESDPSPGTSSSGRTSFLLGAYGKISINDHLGIQPELFYSSTGAKFTSGTTSGTLISNYLALPVFFRYNVSGNFHLLAGPQVSFLLKAKGELLGFTVDVTDQFSAADFSGVIGAGVDFGPINAGLRYSLGLSNIAKNATNGETVKNNVFQIVAGYRMFGK